ncbi:SIMPL domain-containing protein [Candidatus Parcubacteria bacterium]|nr:SIMPL domain-containing protein [Candidatus Parcubacteria bacterium]
MMNTEEVKKIIKLAGVVLVVLALFLFAEALGSFRNLRNAEPIYNSISVSGEGEAVAIPDVATFNFSVSQDAKSVSDAQKQVTEKMNTILAKLKDLGVDDKDIKTTGYYIEPRYTYTSSICSPTYCPPTRQTQDGYTVSHSVSVKIRKTEEAGTALTLVGDEGATNVSNISFTIDDPSQVLKEARDKAIEDAKVKAKELAKKLDVKLVKIISYYDNSGDGGVPLYREALGGDAMLSSKPSPNIPTGENKTTANITLVYEIR